MWGDPGFLSDAQGHSYLKLYFPPLYITSWATSSFNILGGIFLWENFYIFRYLKSDYVMYNGKPLN